MSSNPIPRQQGDGGHRRDLPEDPCGTCSPWFSLKGYPPHLHPTTTCTFRIFSLTPATRTLVLRGTLVLVSKILRVGTLEATGDRESQSTLDWKGP